MASSNISNQAEKEIINSTCKKIGFTEKTEAFGDCYLSIRKEVKKSEKRKQQSLALFESKVYLSEQDTTQIKTTCENLGLQPKTENYGECFLKLRSKTKFSKRLQEIGIYTASPDYINAISINTEEIKPMADKCKLLGFKKQSDDFASCTLSFRTKLINGKKNKYITQHLAQKKNNEALLKQQQQQQQIQAQAAEKSRQLAAAMKTQQQTSNANTAEALQAIFFLLQVGLTLYTLGAFTPGYVPGAALPTDGGWMANGIGWNPLNLNQFPM